MVCKYAEGRSDVRISVVDTAPRWRSIYDLSVWKRAIGGGLQFLRDIMCLSRLLSTRRFDAIHLTTSGQLAAIRDLGVLFIAGLFTVPVIYHIHFGRVPQIATSKNREFRLMARVMLKSQTVVAIDRATRDAIKEFLPTVNVELIPNCVKFSELPSAVASDQSLRTALFIGWVIPTKGIAELVEAWSQLKPQEWRLQIVGPGNAAYRQELIERFRPHGVEFLGELPHLHVMERMAACDLFVLPSYTEGFPNVVLEAMALGKAIVATDVGAIPEMLAAKCGLLVKPKDVQGLTMVLQLLLNDDNLRAELGSSARERALANYSIDAIFSGYMTLWRQAAERRARVH
jgi:glycosyltransferase involved in cell wall biosynthesis